MVNFHNLMVFFNDTTPTNVRTILLLRCGFQTAFQ